MGDSTVNPHAVKPWMQIVSRRIATMLGSPGLAGLRPTPSPGRWEWLLRGAFLLLAAVTLVSSDAIAQWRDTKSGAPLRDSEWRKTSGQLGAMLVVTDKAEAFVGEWTHTPEAHIPIVSTANHVRRGDVVAALLLFAGCGTQGDSCDAVVDFKVLRPDGSVYGELPGNVVYAGLAPRKEIVLLSQAHLMVRIEPTDPYGTYLVIAVLRERAAGRVLQLKQKFDVIP